MGRHPYEALREQYFEGCRLLFMIYVRLLALCLTIQVALFEAHGCVFVHHATHVFDVCAMVLVQVALFEGIVVSDHTSRQMMVSFSITQNTGFCW